MTAADQFARECSVTRNARPDLEKRIHATIRGATARLTPANWQATTPQQRMTLFWSLAYSASCAQGHRGDHRVRILDLSGRELAHQRISTSITCHGDLATTRPDWTIYLC
jgi:hypothetical protein